MSITRQFTSTITGATVNATITASGDHVSEKVVDHAKVTLERELTSMQLEMAQIIMGDTASGDDPIYAVELKSNAICGSERIEILVVISTEKAITSNLVSELKQGLTPLLAVVTADYLGHTADHMMTTVNQATPADIPASFKEGLQEVFGLTDKELETLLTTGHLVQAVPV